LTVQGDLPIIEHLALEEIMHAVVLVLVEVLIVIGLFAARGFGMPVD